MFHKVVRQHIKHFHEVDEKPRKSIVASADLDDAMLGPHAGLLSGLTDNATVSHIRQSDTNETRQITGYRALSHFPDHNGQCTVKAHDVN